MLAEVTDKNWVKNLNSAILKKTEKTFALKYPLDTKSLNSNLVYMPMDHNYYLCDITMLLLQIKHKLQKETIPNLDNFWQNMIANFTFETFYKQK